MKKREPNKDVKTSTLVTLWVLFGILWSAFLIAYFAIDTMAIPLSLSIIACIAIAAVLSWLTVSAVAILMRWRI